MKSSRYVLERIGTNEVIVLLTNNQLIMLANAIACIGSITPIQSPVVGLFFYCEIFAYC